MKRIIFFVLSILSILIIIISIIFIFCRKEKTFNQTDIQLDFTSEAQIYIGNKFNIKADIIANKNQTLNIVIKEPVNLEGLTISCSGDQYDISYKNLSIQNNEHILPSSSFFYGIYEVFKEIFKEINKTNKENLRVVSENNGEVILCGNSVCGEFIIYVNKKDDKISKIELKNTNIIINFK